MSLISKETGQVRGDRIQEILQLVIIPFQNVVIIHDAGKAQKFEPFLQAAFKNGSIGFRKVNSAFIVNEVPDLLEIRVIQKVRHIKHSVLVLYNMSLIPPIVGCQYIQGK